MDEKTEVERVPKNYTNMIPESKCLGMKAGNTRRVGMRPPRNWRSAEKAQLIMKTAANLDVGPLP
jgi:hypothetical protein